MRNSNKGSNVVAILISIGLLVALILTGAGKFAYVTALSLVVLNILVNLVTLVIKD